MKSDPGFYDTTLDVTVIASNFEDAVSRINEVGKVYFQTLEFEIGHMDATSRTYRDASGKLDSAEFQVNAQLTGTVSQ